MIWVHWGGRPPALGLEWKAQPDPECFQLSSPWPSAPVGHPCALGTLGEWWTERATEPVCSHGGKFKQSSLPPALTERGRGTPPTCTACRAESSLPGIWATTGQGSTARGKNTALVTGNLVGSLVCDVVCDHLLDLSRGANNTSLSQIRGCRGPKSLWR